MEPTLATIAAVWFAWTTPAGVLHLTDDADRIPAAYGPEVVVVYPKPLGCYAAFTPIERRAVICTEADEAPLDLP